MRFYAFIITEKRKEHNMATMRSIFKCGTWLLRILVLVIVTVLLLSGAKRKLAKTVTSADYPAAKQQYEQLAEEKGEFRALKAMFSGKDAPMEGGENLFPDRPRKTHNGLASERYREPEPHRAVLIQPVMRRDRA